MANKTYRIDGSAIKLDEKSLVANEQGQIELVRATEEEAIAGTNEYKVIVPSTAKAIASAAVESKQDKLTSANAGTGISITRDSETDVVTISNTNSAAIWGNITGTLTDQTDLKNALDAKQDPATTLAGYGITDAYTKTEVDGKFSGIFHYKGTVNTYDDLPTEGMLTGDVYNVIEKHETDPVFPAGANLAWSGEDWDVLGGVVDLSAYSTTDEMNIAISTAVNIEKEAREAADTAINNKIGTGFEDKTITTKVTEVSEAVSTEESRAKGVEGGLDTRLTIAEGDIDNLESDKEDKLTSENAGEGIKIERDTETGKVTISNTNLSAEWGNIEGTLSNQTDLQDALDAKQDKLVESDSIKIDSNNKITAVEATVGGSLLNATSDFNLKYNEGAILNSVNKTATFTSLNTYIQAPVSMNQFISADSWEVGLTLAIDQSSVDRKELCLFSFDNSPHNDEKDHQGIALTKYQNGITAWASKTGSDWDLFRGSQRSEIYSLVADSIYDFKISFTGTHYLVKAKLHSEENWTTIQDIETSDKIGTNDNATTLFLTLANNRWREHGSAEFQVLGDYYLEDCYVSLNGEEVWRGYSDVPSVGTKGIVNLYDTTGNAEDGSLTQKAVSELHNTVLLAIEAEETRAKATEVLKANIEDVYTKQEVDERIIMTIKDYIEE